MPGGSQAEQAACCCLSDEVEKRCVVGFEEVSAGLLMQRQPLLPKLFKNKIILDTLEVNVFQAIW